MFSKDSNFFGGHGIVGASVPLGTGLAFSNKYKNNNAVTLTYFGDGAANQGQVYESFNMAKLWNLPCIYIIENNRYAMGTSVQRSSAQKDLSQRGVSFGIDGEQVDGMNIESVIEAGKRAVQKTRSNEGPYILEMLTYRYRGHSMSDPAQYRSRDEVKEVRDFSDPIENLKNKIISKKFSTEEEIKKINTEIKNIVDLSAEFAAESPFPPADELFKDIYI
jgi:pyruvate dehydrogenase E1 component alpha subunit